MMDEIIITGRRRIMAFMGVKSWRTVQRWRRKSPGFRKLLRRNHINGKPFVLSLEILEFLTIYDDMVKCRTKKKSPGPLQSPGMPER